MNKDRKQALLEATSVLDEAIDLLCEVQAEEQDAYDSMPEGLQCSVRGDSMQEAIDMIDGWNSDIEKIIKQIEEYALPKKKSGR